MTAPFRPPIFLVLGALAACASDATGPQPEPEPLRVEFFYCAESAYFGPRGAPPWRDAVVLADLEFTGRVEDAEAAVRANGGRVVHRFHVRLVRVAIRYAAISRLPMVWVAKGVVDPQNLEVPVGIQYSRAVTDADLERLAQAGVRQLKSFATVPDVVWGRADDPRIPGVRALPGVSRVELDGTFCV